MAKSSRNPVTRVKTSDGTFAVEIHDDTDTSEFFVAGQLVAPDTFIASVLVEWFDQLGKPEQHDVQHEEQ